MDDTAPSYDEVARRGGPPPAGAGGTAPDGQAEATLPGLDDARPGRDGRRPAGRRPAQGRRRGNGCVSRNSPPRRRNSRGPWRSTRDSPPNTSGSMVRIAAIAACNGPRSPSANSRTRPHARSGCMNRRPSRDLRSLAPLDASWRPSLQPTRIPYELAKTALRVYRGPGDGLHRAGCPRRALRWGGAERSAPERHRPDAAPTAMFAGTCGSWQSHPFV